MLYRFLNKHKENGICRFYLSFDPIVAAIRWMISKCKKSPAAAADVTEKDDTPTE